MNGLGQISFEQEPGPGAEPPRDAVRARRRATLALAVSIAALVCVAWLAWDAQSRSEIARQAVGQKLAEIEALANQNAALLKQVQAQLGDDQSRVAQVEGKLTEMQAQRIALEEMYRELARAPDDWLLAEIEQTINVAAQQLQLAGNVRAAIMALQTADARLARADKMQTVHLRRALNQDLERLKAQPLVDTTGISIRLDNLVSIVDALPLVISETSPASRAAERLRDPGEGAIKRFALDVWDELSQLVRIRRLEDNEAALISPRQSYFLRENLKLRLLTARLALVARDETNYKEDLRQAREWLARYFDPKAKANVSAAATLKQLQDSAISIAVPEINASINAVRSARAARERPAR